MTIGSSGGSLPGLIGFDYAALTSWMQAKAGVGTTHPVGIASQAERGPAVLPPWDPRAPQESETARRRELRSDGPLFAGLDGTESKDIPEAERKLFTLYQAVKRLWDLADEAARPETVSGLRAGMDRRFQSWSGELQDHLRDLSIEGLTLLPGAKTDHAESAIALARSTSRFTGAPAHLGARDAPMSSIAGDEAFTIALSKGGVPTEVTIDLAAMGDTPRSIDAIADFINSRLDAAGVVSRFAVVAFGADHYGFRIDGVSTETLRFTPAAAAPAVYVAGIGGAGAQTIGQIRKLDGITGSDPATAWTARIAPEDASAAANAAALDSQGNLYVVGRSTGDAGSQRNQAAEQDMFLSKYDAAGNLVWTRLLGASESAEGFAVAVDADDQIVVAGAARGHLTADTRGGGEDSFVSKFDDQGHEIWTRQIAPAADDRATTLAIDGAGTIYVAGRTKGAIAAGIAHGGGSDTYLVKLGAEGQPIWQRQLGGAGDERAAALAIAADGNPLLATIEDGRAVLRKLDAADSAAAPLWALELGPLDGGSLSGLAVDGEAIYLAGDSANAALDAGGAARLIGTPVSGSDAFLARLSDGGASVSAEWTRYLGTAAAERGHAVAAHGGMVYLAGSTGGALPGAALQGQVDGFVAQFDTSGGLNWVHQYAGLRNQGAAMALAVDGAGSSVLTRLGLPHGRLDYEGARGVSDRTTARPGQSFAVAVEGGRPKTITIEPGESLRRLALKITMALGLKGRAEVVRSAEGERLRITASGDAAIDLIGGPQGRDALGGLGLAPGRLLPGAGQVGAENEASAAASERVFGLGLEPGLRLVGRADAEHARTVLGKTLSAIRSAYRALTRDPALDAAEAQSAQKPAPAYLQRRLAEYQAALARLNGPLPFI